MAQRFCPPPKPSERYKEIFSASTLPVVPVAKIRVVANLAVPHGFATCLAHGRGIRFILTWFGLILSPIVTCFFFSFSISAFFAYQY
jgi:uncharacterized membrane protein YecN with MAPEG domain